MTAKKAPRRQVFSKHHHQQIIITSSVGASFCTTTVRIRLGIKLHFGGDYNVNSTNHKDQFHRNKTFYHKGLLHVANYKK